MIGSVVSPISIPPFKNRSSILQRIEELDPVDDHHEIYFLCRGYEFPIEFAVGGLLSFLHDFTIPSIGSLLHKTMEFNNRTNKRMDDTSIILIEIIKHGYDSERGRLAIRRMNDIHRRFKIANNDYLYVLSSIVFEPIFLIDRFGYRPLTNNEKQSAFYFWKEVGLRMHLTDIPPTYEAFLDFNRQVKQRRVRYTQAGAAVGKAVIDSFVKKFPYAARPLMRQLIYLTADDAIRKALRLPLPHPAAATLLRRTLRLRAGLIRRFPVRKKAFFSIDHPMDTYQYGYELTRVGADISS